MGPVSGLTGGIVGWTPEPGESPSLRGIPNLALLYGGRPRVTRVARPILGPIAGAVYLAGALPRAETA